MRRILNFFGLYTKAQYTDARLQLLECFSKQWNVEREQLIDHLDEFLELRLKAEFDELREDIERISKS